MKPPLFIECSVCGREFGSKSIVIHEPQCLQKLRRTEILQRERETAPTTTSNYHGKKTRRRKKVVVERRKEEVEATGTITDKTGPTSFVLMATSSSSIVPTATEKLPKIQSSTSSISSFKVRRPCTAILEKPRILNPEYIQYDMSLTRIDFTGQPKSTGMDENQNSRLQRQNTQVLDNNQKTNFILPTVDGTGIFSKYSGKIQRSADNVSTKLVPCCGNMTVDSILGDPQKKSHRGDHRGETTILVRESETEVLDKTSPQIDTLFAAPHFLRKYSQCDLEKPLPTCFHLEKMPGHRPAFESKQDYFVTPTTSECVSSPTVTRPGCHVPSDGDNRSGCTTPEIIPCDKSQTTGKDQPCDESTFNSSQPESSQFLNVQSQEEESEEALIRFDSPCQKLGVETTTPPFTSEEWTGSKKTGILNHLINSCKCFSKKTAQPQPNLSNESLPQIDKGLTGLTTAPNWIGQPFMTGPNYYSVPLLPNDQKSKLTMESEPDSLKLPVDNPPLEINDKLNYLQDEQTFLEQSFGENRMERLRRPFLTHSTKDSESVEDSVSVWEGSHIVSQSNDGNGENSSNLFLPIIENQEPLPPRPPTRRRRSSESIPVDDSNDSPPAQQQEPIVKIQGKTIGTKNCDKKIQHLISDVCRLHQLQREKFKQMDSQQRPKTSPASFDSPSILRSTKITRPATANINRRTCIGMIPFSKNKLGRLLASQSNENTKIMSRRSPSKSAAISHNVPSKRERCVNFTRPATATFGISFKPRVTTVKTALGFNNFDKSGKVFNKKIKNEQQRPYSSPSPSPYSSYSTDEEPLELIYSFKSKTHKKKTKSPMGLCSPLEMIKLDKASFYTQLELRRRQALSEQKKLIAKVKNVGQTNRHLNDLINNNDSTSSPFSSPRSTSCNSTPLASPKLKTKDQTTGKRLLRAKQVLRELSQRINKADKISALPRKSPPVNLKVKLKMNQGKSEGGGGEEDRRSVRRSEIPVPISKRVQFSSPIQQQQIPRKKVFKKVKQTNSSLKKNKSSNSGGDKVRITINGPPKDPETPRTLKLSYIKNNDDKNKEVEAIPITKVASSKKKLSCGPSCHLPMEAPEPPETNDQESRKKRELRETMERLENQRERHRGKDYDRHNRDGNKGGAGNDNEYSTASLMIPKKDPVSADKMLNVKIIVRRKNADGSLPAIENVVHTFTTKWTYLIVDEQPLTHTSPNPYLTSHKTRPKVKRNDDNFYSLKITTSNQSTIDSLPSEEALNRFLTCYICGKSVNVRDYPDHERECLHEIKDKNELLEPQEKRILPLKPQGTITIKNWNMFAYEALKEKYVQCPFCKMQYFPDRQDEVDHHEELCKDRVFQSPSAAGIRDEDEGTYVTYGKATVQTADDAIGWLVPSTKELRRGDWNRAAERVESFTRPAARRYKHYKKLKTSQ